MVIETILFLAMLPPPAKPPAVKKPVHPCDVRDRHGKKPKKVKFNHKKLPRSWVCDDDVPDRDKGK